jgi:enoyl-CoA hydratase/carnithine racemase
MMDSTPQYASEGSVMIAKQIRIDKRSSAYWRATFDSPPINLIDPQTIHELDALVGEIESDPEVRVVVFDSADHDFFLAHFDVLVDKAVTSAMKPGRTGLHPWLDVPQRYRRTGNPSSGPKGCRKAQ